MRLMTSQLMPRAVGAALTGALELMALVTQTDHANAKLAGSRHLTSRRGIHPMKEVNV